MTCMQYSDHFLISLAHSTLHTVIWAQGLLTQYQKKTHCVFHTLGIHSCDTHTFTWHTHIQVTCPYVHTLRAVLWEQDLLTQFPNTAGPLKGRRRGCMICVPLFDAHGGVAGVVQVCVLVGAYVYVWPSKVCSLSLSLPLFLSILSSLKLSFSQALLSLG